MGKHLSDERDSKSLIYVFGGTLLISIVLFFSVFNIYDSEQKEEAQKALVGLQMQNSIVSNDELKQVSYSDDKTVSSSINVNVVNNSSKMQNKVSKMPVEAKVTKSVNNTLKNEVNNTIANIVTNTINNNQLVETKEELKFIAPVSGEISKDFAKDTLIYSNTLEEWTTHLGIDIKANKTTIVVASEKGVVESIKNDPRFGLTVVIKHSGGFKTVYSNLLTTEFVKEGESVEKGQTIGTVGESASFEIAEEAHLHFEMYKDGEVLNPTIYLK